MEALHQPKAGTGGLFKTHHSTRQRQEGAFQSKLELVLAGKTMKHTISSVLTFGSFIKQHVTHACSLDNSSYT